MLRLAHRPLTVVGLSSLAEVEAGPVRQVASQKSFCVTAARLPEAGPPFLVGPVHSGMELATGAVLSVQEAVADALYCAESLRF